MQITFDCTEAEYIRLFGFDKVPQSFFTDIKSYPLTFNGTTIAVVPISFTEESTDIWEITAERKGRFVFQELVEVRRPSKEELQATEAVKKAEESLKAAKDTLKAVKDKK